MLKLDKMTLNIFHSRCCGDLLNWGLGMLGVFTSFAMRISGGFESHKLHAGEDVGSNPILLLKGIR